MDFYFAIKKHQEFSKCFNAVCYKGGGNVATLIILILVMLLPAVIAEYGRYKGWWY